MNGLKQCFDELCWKKYRKNIVIDPKRTRFSVNFINNGLVWHHDFVLQRQEDFSLTSPGLTFVIHLGECEKDIVCVDYFHDRSKRTVCKPGTAHVFPGGCFLHRTIREFNVRPDDVRAEKKRFSLAVFANFKREKSMEMDIALHAQFPGYTDDFKCRSRNWVALTKVHGF